jgi:hypothetical protein
MRTTISTKKLGGKRPELMMKLVSESWKEYFRERLERSGIAAG